MSVLQSEVNKRRTVAGSALDAIENHVLLFGCRAMKIAPRGSGVGAMIKQPR
jgi:hypothetical protein